MRSLVLRLSVSVYLRACLYVLLIFFALRKVHIVLKESRRLILRRPSYFKIRKAG
jgi:hypothetical protein